MYEDLTGVIVTGVKSTETDNLYRCVIAGKHGSKFSGYQYIEVLTNISCSIRVFIIDIKRQRRIGIL